MPRSFSVMSLNLRFGLAEDGPNSWVHRRASYKPLFDAFPRDFYAFQEVNDFQTTFLGELLRDHCPIGQRPCSPDRWQNNIIFYHRHWQCIHCEHFYLSDTPDEPSQFVDSRWPRQCTLGIFEQGGFSVIIANTHLDFSAEVQIRSAKVILRRLARHAGKGCAIVMGDFNSTPDGACYAEFTNQDGKPFFKNAFEPPYVGTHHHFSGSNGGDAIDWILYQEPLVVKRAAVITDAFAGKYPSDHFPVTAEFCPPLFHKTGLN